MSMTNGNGANGEAMIKGFKFLSQNDLLGYGGLGEGMAISIAKDGRRIMWLAHEFAPKNFTGVDVTDPRNPKIVVQTELPEPYMRSNSLELTGDIMAVAYQCKDPGQKPAGMELFDISNPEEPKSISFFDCSGPYSRGVHQLWFCDGEYVHLAAGSADFQPHNQKDDQFYRIIDVRNPSKPQEVGRWWLPGVRVGDTEAPPVRHKVKDAGFRVHNTNVYPQRPDRAYLGVIDGGAVLLDISDKSQPKMISRWDNSPPFTGFTHTLLPLFERQLIVSTDESTMDAAADWPKLVWILDAREEKNLVPISTCPMPPKEEFANRGGRFGAHNLHENVPRETSFQSEEIIFGTFFNGGTRAFDISNAFQPKRDRAFRAAGSAQLEGRARSSSTTCSSTSGRSSTRSTGIPAGSTSLETDF